MSRHQCELIVAPFLRRVPLSTHLLLSVSSQLPDTIFALLNGIWSLANDCKVSSLM